MYTGFILKLKFIIKGIVDIYIYLKNSSVSMLLK